MHAHIHIFIYIEECIFKQQVVIKASFVKDDGKLFIFYCKFSSLLGKEVAKKLPCIFCTSIYIYIYNLQYL